MHTDSRFSAAVEAAVSRIEETTDAELVVVAAPRSGHYRDSALAFGVLLGFAQLLVAQAVPFQVDPWWLILEFAFLVPLATWAAHRFPWLLRLLTSRRRRAATVARAAAAAFHEDQVHATRARTGLLVYLSAFEEEVVVIPDHGLAARIPQAEWNAIDWDARSLEGFVLSLDRAGAVLARHLPARPDDNPDELPNAPRIRS